MEKISIIKFNLNKCNSAQKTSIQRALRGYIDHSNKGSYLYKRKGILNELPHHIISKSVIMVRSKDKNKILSILKDYKSSYDVFNLYSSKEKLG